jgi:hypothetical protein
MKKKTAMEIQADRLLSYINTTGFKETLGVWISQGKRDVMLRLRDINDPAEQQKAVGEFRAYDNLEQRILSTLANAEIMHKKRQAKLERNKK